MKINYAEFRKDKHFFLKYFSMQMILMVFLTVLVIKSAGNSFDFTPKLSMAHLLILPFAYCFGLQVPVLLHNVVHNNIKPKWLNELLGELCGFFVLFGMAPFRISHTLHHAHPDDLEKDPHAPDGKSFLHFLANTQMNTIKTIANHYFKFHGRSSKTYCIMAVQMLCYYVGLILRLFLWYKLLGATFFVVFYVPAYLTNLIVFAHINFATHQTLSSGEVIIVNLNHNLYYKTVNFLGSGAYFHKNHHINPRLYNPSTLIAAKSTAKKTAQHNLSSNLC
jgi:fatty acid desaturase